jgi:thiol-disulfide isomerase/thioredoxin
MSVAFLSKMESPFFYRALSFVSFVFGAVLCWLASLSYLSGVATVSLFWVVLGVCALGLGLVFPVRIVRIGATLPIEIARNVKILAVTCPLGGVALCFAGAGLHPLVQMVGFAVCGLCVCVAALFGFLRLSFSLPRTFYMGEMASIFVSTGVWGKIEESNSERSFSQWTKGKVEGVPVGAAAPDGELVTLDGETRMLSTYFESAGSEDSSLLVLNFGSYSCPHHRKRLEELTGVMDKWQPKGVRFLTVYTAEAHPEDGWKLDNQYQHDPEFTGDAGDFCFFYAKTIDDRREMATWLIEKKGFSMPVVLDQIDDNLLFAYNSWPIRLYVIDNGTVVFSGKQGPFGYAPAELDAALSTLLD